MLSENLSHAEIMSALRLEGITTCHKTVWLLEKHIREHRMITPLPKSGKADKTY